jgi:UDP-N-acetylmuramoylalanine--D-glutamate ligase
MPPDVTFLLNVDTYIQDGLRHSLVLVIILAAKVSCFGFSARNLMIPWHYKRGSSINSNNGSRSADARSWRGANALVMGLGLNGGGLETAKFLLSHGAVVTVTDMKDEAALADPVNALRGFADAHGYPAVRFVLGKHEAGDFEKADVVLKNPIVHPDSPFLLAAKRVETDMSLFLAENPARLIAVTGSKGKSTTASAIHHVLGKYHEQTGRGKAYLGGNITVSPLSFLDRLTGDDDVVLELSSWQLGDLRGKTDAAESSLRYLLKPRVAVLTAIMPDHQNWYHGMEPYVADKCVIYRYQDETCATVTLDDAWGARFLAETRAKKVSIADAPAGLRSLAPCIPGVHNKQNLVLAGLALAELGLPLSFITACLEQYPGIEHRLEFFHEHNGVRYYNDSAATIPEAAASALDALPGSVFITGGTDKDLDLTPLAAVCDKARDLILLAGSGTDKLIPLLTQSGIMYQGPFGNLDDAVKTAIAATRPGLAVLFSPGCTSFGMFTGEFDRGHRFKAAVKRYTG